VKTTANDNIKLDVRGDGGFCVLPPSLHKSGGLYEIVHDAEPADLPQNLLEFIATKAGQAGGAPPMSPANTSKGKPPSRMNGVVRPGNLLRAERAPPAAETMRETLRHLADSGCFGDRSGVLKDVAGSIDKVGWVEAGMALKLAYGDEVGFELWRETHADDRALNDAPTQWASFAVTAQAGQTTIGTLIKP
jgi:hypothetical protein